MSRNPAPFSTGASPASLPSLFASQPSWAFQQERVGDTPHKRARTGEGGGGGHPGLPNTLPDDARSAHNKSGALDEPGCGDSDDDFSTYGPWVEACSDSLVPLHCWPAPPRQLGEGAGDATGMTKVVQSWNVAALLQAPRPCTGPIPHLLVRVCVEPRASSDAAWGGGGGEDESVLLAVEDPTGRMVAVMDGAAHARFDVKQGAVLLLKDAYVYKLPGSGPAGRRLIVDTVCLHRVYAPR